MEKGEIGKVNVLGTDYTICIRSEEDDESLSDFTQGYCEFYSKKIIVKSIDENNKHIYENIEEYQQKVIRHELVHAFLHESGLDSNSEWARNEELVDWIALQFDKMSLAFDESKKLFQKTDYSRMNAEQRKKI